MSAIDIIRSHYEASARGDLAGMLAVFDPEIRWTEMRGSTYAGTYIGAEQIVQNVFGPISEHWTGFAVTVQSLHEAGDTVIAVGNYTGVFNSTGRVLDTRVAHVWKVAGDKAVSFEQFTDTLMIDRATR